MVKLSWTWGGAGVIASELSDESRVVLVDLSYPLLAQVRRMKNMTLVCADLQTLFLKIKADIIICTGVLEHLGQPKQALSYFNYLLQDNGKLYIRVPVLNLKPAKLIVPLYRKLNKITVEPMEHLRVYSTRTLTRDLSYAGFTVGKAKYIPIGGPCSMVGKGFLKQLAAKEISVVCSKVRKAGTQKC